MARKLAVLVGGWFLLSAGPVAAQAPVSGQLYGTGVHAYFTGDYGRARELLTSAVKTDGQDPRAWYFRGLACLKLGAPEDAKGDFQQGSKLESADQDRMYNISKALERVQGADRKVLEQYRAAARLKAYERANEERKARYEALRREESRVLQQPPGSPPVPPGSKVPVAPDVRFGETGPAPKPAPPTPPAAPAKPEGNIFDEPPAKPATPTPPPAPAGKSTAPPAATSPFEPDAPAEKPAAAKKPAVADVPAPEDPSKADFFAKPPVTPGTKPIAGQPVDEGASEVKVPSGKPTAKKGTSKKAVGEPSGAEDVSPFEDPAAAPKAKGTGKKSPTGGKRPAPKKPSSAPAKDPDEDFGAGGAGNVPSPFEGDSETAPKKPGRTK